MAIAETAGKLPARGGVDERGFFRSLVTVMAIVQASGFVLQAALGRSSFGAPLIVHLHAVAFMGWVAIFAVQPWLAKSGAMNVHRMLGRTALLWAISLFVLGPMVTWASVNSGRMPFFFQPQHFLVDNPIMLFAGLGMFAAAVVMRKQHDWHPRLQIGSFVMLMGPGFGRLLPMPLMMPWAFEISCVAPLVFVAFAAMRDFRKHQRVHPAWAWTVGVLIGSLVLGRLVAASPIGAAIYAAAVAGTSAAGGDGLAFPPPPPMP